MINVGTPLQSTSTRWDQSSRKDPQSISCGMCTTNLLVSKTRKWIEECTGCKEEKKGFREYLQDGILLCELLQRVHPGLVKKINRTKSPFAWRENLTFFLEACRKLGLKGSQLFTTEDLQPPHSPGYKTNLGENQRKLRNVSVTIYWLARRLEDFTEYKGPLLDIDQSLLEGTASSKAHTEPFPQRKKHNLTVSPPNSPSLLSSGCQPCDSPVVKVHKVESVVTHTDQQAFAQRVRFIGGTTNSSEREDRNSEVNGFAEEVTSTPELYLTQNHHIFGRVASSIIEPYSPAALPELVFYNKHLPSGSGYPTQSPAEPESCSSPPLSEVSTLVASLQSPSHSTCELGRTSAASTTQSEYSGTESSFGSPPVKRHTNTLPPHISPITPSASAAFREHSFSSTFQQRGEVCQDGQCDSAKCYLNHEAEHLFESHSLLSEVPQCDSTLEVVSSPTLDSPRSSSLTTQTTKHLADVQHAGLDCAPTVGLSALVALSQALKLPQTIQTSASTDDQSKDCECLEEMAGKSQLLRIYPSPSKNSSGACSSVTTVPHHSLNTTSNTGGPESPPLQRASARRTLCIEPSSNGDTTTQASTEVARPRSYYAQATKPSSCDDTEEFDIPLVLLPGEKLLGFTVAGGKDQGAYPRVQSIEGATPASRSHLQCEDELLAVDSVSLQDTVHSKLTEILLHKAMTSSRIKLHVRRHGKNSDHHHQHTSSVSSEHTSDSSLGPPIMAFNIDEVSEVQGSSLMNSHSKMVVPTKDSTVDSRGDAPDCLSDVTSTAVEVGSSIDDFEKLSFCESHLSTSSFQNDTSSHHELSISPKMEFKPDEDSLVSSVLADTLRQSKLPNDNQRHSQKTGRPVSAPNSHRAVSTGVVPAGLSLTLPAGISPAVLREKRASLDEERKKRRSNIEVGARAARQYSATHKFKKTDSLPSKLYFSPGTVRYSLTSEEDSQKGSTSSEPRGRSSSSPAQPSTPLNLRNLNLNETREASFNQMDEIWKEVESESSEPSRTDLMVDESTSLSLEVDTHTIPCGNNGIEKPEEPNLLSSVATSSPTSDLQPVSASKQQRISHTDSDVFEDTTNRPSLQSTTGNTVTDGVVPSSALEDSTSSTQTSSINNKGIESLLMSLRSLNDKVGTYEEEEEFQLLEEMLQSNTFKKAKQFHDGMRSLLDESSKHPHPVMKRVGPALHATRYHLHHFTEPTDDVNELRTLLRNPHIQAVLFCHDKVSSRDLFVSGRTFHQAARDPEETILSSSFCDLYLSSKPIDTSIPLSRDVPSSRKEEATIVFLSRTNRPLGCTLYQQGEAVFIGRLLKGCDAEQSDVLREGDELLEVNGIPVMGRSTDEIVRLMSSEPETTLVLTIIPVHDDKVDLEYEPKYIRAHFNYNGRLDDDIPCKALGLTFLKGDILEISNQDDPDWWQARKVFEDGAESLPGLIPARHLQQKREALTRTHPYSSSLDERHKKKSLRSIFSKRKKRKIYYQQTPPSGMFAVGDEIVTYEDVVQIDPVTDRKRPIILIGASGVGRKTLIRKLINSDTSLFCPVLQHTTRMIRPGEINGRDYFFVTREEFERDMHLDHFLEYEELKGHYYGTAFSSIKKVIEAGRVPVMDLHPQSLKLMRYSGLMPYVVFIASPRLERLHITRRICSEKQKRRLSSHSTSQSEFEGSQIYTEAELQHLVKESHLIDSQYSHYFDWIIVNDDFQVAADMLKEVSRRIEDEPQWVPASWTQEL